MFSSNTIMKGIFITELTEATCLSGAVPYAALKIVRRPKEEVRVETCSELQLWYNLAHSYSYNVLRLIHNL